MDHDLESIVARLEILEIKVCSILQNPGNMGNLGFSTSSYPGNIGKRIFSTSSHPGNIGSFDPCISPILEIVDRTIHIQSYPGNSGSYDPRKGSRCCTILEKAAGASSAGPTQADLTHSFGVVVFVLSEIYNFH